MYVLDTCSCIPHVLQQASPILFVEATSLSKRGRAHSRLFPFPFHTPHSPVEPLETPLASVRIGLAVVMQELELRVDGPRVVQFLERLWASRKMIAGQFAFSGREPRADQHRVRGVADAACFNAHLSLIIKVLYSMIIL